VQRIDLAKRENWEATTNPTKRRPKKDAMAPVASSDDDEEYVSDGAETSDSEWDDSDGEDERLGGRTLLWLCQEGQMDRALEKVVGWDREHPVRVAAWSTDNTSSSHDAGGGGNRIPHQELFQKNTDGNYALHEVLMGGTADPSALALVRRLVARYRSDYPVESRIVFQTRPQSHGRTVLHWCAWGNNTSDVVLWKQIMLTYPESLCLRDDKAHGTRTPLEIAKHYWPNSVATPLLERWTQNYLPYRLQRTVHLGAHRHFVTSALTPFDKNDRKRAGLAPRPWFVASVIGYSLQREMLGLALRILSFVGKGAKVSAGKKKKKKASGSRGTQKVRKRRRVST
jgi:hypothetical protein